MAKEEREFQKLVEQNRERKETFEFLINEIIELKRSGGKIDGDTTQEYIALNKELDEINSAEFRLFKKIPLPMKIIRTIPQGGDYEIDSSTSVCKG